MLSIDTQLRQIIYKELGVKLSEDKKEAVKELKDLKRFYVIYIQVETIISGYSIEDYYIKEGPTDSSYHSFKMKGKLVEFGKINNQWEKLDSLNI